MQWNGKDYRPIVPQKIVLKKGKFDVEEYIKSLAEKHHRIPVWRTIQKFSMTKVAIITTEQYDLLVEQFYGNDSMFNPVKDCNENWVISEQEIEFCTNSDFDWIKNLPLIDWCGPYIPVSGYTGNYFDQFFSGKTGDEWEEFF